ncbi:NmrA/HSCARG family protein [Meiothermus granaticius]|uniref:NAD(P)H azoreductase n=1 Tax=Meiothermus granaticius NBRC 107808 TaxID=1227551 RepID=A0A399FCU0_9DEIN|nr:NmrA/HSCARG family protein [Meiothermus granaticius]MCL6527554.1 NmrA/HSCARG family protein [Thermaceae bacterium]RIH93545.1 NAD(P)H azoreductase [Meiothermus granaticius NBRC 107808]GEM86041.1 hypothetical protein MGR01S_06660 [Meiothermus granaticius NBRC 107808]
MNDDAGIVKRRVLVVGATGQQGGAAARHLKARGWRVRALTHDLSSPKAVALTRAGFEVVQGDLDDRPSLEGVQGVFSVQPWEGTEAGIEDQIRQGKALADAVAAAKIGHLVHSSVDGAERGSGIPHFENQFVVEEHIHALGLPATILRPVFFMENFYMSFAPTIASGVVGMNMRPEIPVQIIAVDDIGAIAAVAFEDPDLIGQSLPIAGDELTMTQVAQELSRVLGRPIRYQDYGDLESEDFLSREFRVMFDWYHHHGYRADIAATRALHPGLLTLGAWLGASGFGQVPAGTGQAGQP